MRIAALYDIHGNLPALEAVLREVRRADVDRIIVGGDVVPGPMPIETIDWLRALDIRADYIKGNGDREVVALKQGSDTGVPERFRPVMRWNAEQLRPEDEQWLAGWPLTLRVQVPGIGDVLFCHATPRNDTEIFTRLTAEDRLAPIFDRLGAPLVICGHTHMQFDRMVGGTRVVNAGSVGMPFGEPGAYWLLLDEDGPRLQRTVYDLELAAERVRMTTYPQAGSFAATNIMNPPSEAVMLKAFGAGEIG